MNVINNNSSILAAYLAHDVVPLETRIGLKFIRRLKKQLLLKCYWLGSCGIKATGFYLFHSED